MLEVSEKQRRAIAFGQRDTFWFSAEGAVRSGKTFAANLGFLLYTQTGARREQTHVMAGRTFTSLRRNCLDPFCQEVEALGGHYHFNRQEGELRANGVRYAVFGANDERSADRMQGMTAGSALLDEIALMPRNFVEQCGARQSFPDSKRWSTLNPESPRHYLHERLEADAEKGLVERLTFTLYDNPWLTDEVRERYAASFSGVYYQRFILGQWAAAEGVVWPQAVFEAPDVAGRRRRSTEATLDYASSGTVAMLVIDRYDGGIDHVRNELYLNPTGEGRTYSDAEIAGRFLDLVEGEVEEQRLRVLWLDPSAASLRAEFRTRKVPFIVRRGLNDVLPGIRSVGVRMKTRMLFIDPSCKRLVNEVRGYQWDPKAAGRGEDKPLKLRDHGCDALRYFVYSRYRRTMPGSLEKPEGW